jgi:hypothetical protein
MTQSAIGVQRPMLHPAVVVRLCLMATVLVGCGSGSTPIPAGAQEVHVVITESEVRLDPATVRAGDVYLVLDAPADGSIVFVEQQLTATETPGPLSDEALERLAGGDTEGTAIGGIDAGGCDPAQNAAARGHTGPCGNAMHLVLVEGKYAILGDAPELQPQMAVLEVLP